MECITRYHHNHLVVAGAGTGKTTTIVGKIKWLLSSERLFPEEILVLSFTNASAAEMRGRIHNETNCLVSGKTRPESVVSRGSTFGVDGEVYAATFHKLGLEIIRRVNPTARIAQDPENKTEDEIDFEDMITLATQYLNSGAFVNPFKFVIVDEYQDISRPRYELLQALRRSRDFDLFCVGDDWQAIYGFAGSEIDLILNFEKHWGKTQLSKIETTYRFPDSLAEASGKFIMENPAQIPKKIRALPDDDLPPPRVNALRRLFGVYKRPRKSYAVTEICADSQILSIEASKRILMRLHRGATVYYIGRYTRDKDYLRRDRNFAVLDTEAKLKSAGLSAEQCEGAGVPVVFDCRKDLKIKFLTAHKSKGLQAEYVFVMNLKNGRKGFPSKILSKANMDAAPEKVEAAYEDEARTRGSGGGRNEDRGEKFPFAEERRLFYVTLTRAKKHVFLLTTFDHKSEFVEELEDLLYGKMKIIPVGMRSSETLP